MSNKLDITIAITAHREGTLIHHTLMSIVSAIRKLPKKVSCEIIIHADNPNDATLDYLNRSQQFIPDSITTRRFTNQFGDPGTSRNFCAKKAQGRYIAFIDGDDLMCDNWLKDAYDTLESSDHACVAHSEYTIEFGDFNSIVKKYPAINREVDSLLSVWAGRWNAIIFAPTDIVNKIGYPQAKDGYGFEDWEMSCKLISSEINNVTIPQTVMFVRRKSTDSVGNKHRSERTVLRKNNCLSFSYIRSVTEPEEFTDKASQHLIISRSIERYRNSRTLPIRVLKKVYRMGIKIRDTSPQSHLELPKWLIDQWKLAHNHDRSIFPHNSLIHNPSIYHTITQDHYRVGHAYKHIIDQTKHDSYDYLIFVPWLISGGADLYSINIANELVNLYPKKRVAIIATMPSPYSTPIPLALRKEVDLISLAPSINNLNSAHIDRLLEHFIENSGASTLHIINSMQAYDFLETHSAYLSQTNKKVILTSFSQSVDPRNDRLYGYSHTHVPKVYEIANVITTDNYAVANMWVNDYGFDDNKIQVIRPLVKTIGKDAPIRVPEANQSSKKVLWAARLAPEKLVELIPKIANHLPKTISIDMYGTPGEDFDSSLLDKLPSNVSYKGPFTDFYKLPLGSYSAFLYTSLFDGIPNALVEATSAKLPIVASASGGIGEFITQDTGVLVDDIYNAKSYADGVIQILNNTKLANSYVDAATHMLEKDYSPSRFSEAIRNLIETIND